MLTITPNINNLPKIQGREYNSTPRISRMNQLDKDVFTPSFQGNKIELPIEILKQKGEAYLNKLTKSTDLFDKRSIVIDYINDVKTLGAEAFDGSKAFNYEKKSDRDFAHSFFHEVSGSYVEDCVVSIDTAIAEEKIPTNIEKKFQTAVDFVNKALGRYQFFIDNKENPHGVKKVFELTQDAFKELAQDKNIKIEVDGQHLLENYSKTPGNDFNTYEVLSNFIGNSIKYSPENSTINLGFKQKNNGLNFIIKDAGIGIPPENQKTVFQQMRADNVENIPGTGLGYSLIADIVGGSEKIKITSPLYPNAPKYKGTMIECPLISSVEKEPSAVDKFKKGLSNLFK